MACLSFIKPARSAGFSQIKKLGKNFFSEKVDFVVRLNNEQNGKLVSLKKVVFFGVLTNIWDPENFTFVYPLPSTIPCFKDILVFAVFPLFWVYIL